MISTLEKSTGGGAAAAGQGLVAARMRCRPATGLWQSPYVQSESSKISPKPLIIFKAPYPCFPSTGGQRLPSCGLQSSLLECGERAKRRGLQDAVRPRWRTRKHHDVAASRRRGLRSASRRSSSDQPVALHERLLARPGDDARHDRPGLAILSDQFADLLAAGLAAGAGQAGLGPRRHAEAGARPVSVQLTASAIRSTACRWCSPRTCRTRSAAR